MRMNPPRDRGVGWARYMWLLYLVFYFGTLVADRATGSEWAWSMLAVAVFLPLYFAGFRTRGTRLLVIASLIYALGIAILPVNAGGNSFFIYAVAFVPFAVPPRRAALWIAVMLAGVLAQAWWFHWSPYLLVITVIVAGIVGATNIAFAEARRRDDKLRVAQHAVEEMARIAERERIGRDLHDLLGHTLSVIVLKSELASKLAGRDPDRAVNEIREVERISRHALAEVRKAVSGYRSEGLADEVANAERVLVAAGIRPIIDLGPHALGSDEDRTLAFALREAVTNVVRHAGARQCWIALAVRDGHTVLEVRDDGRGGLAPEGNGLSGLRERLHLLAGTLERDGRDGTRLLMTLPGRRTPHGATA